MPSKKDTKQKVAVIERRQGQFDQKEENKGEKGII